jgi:hypothetical protein
MIAAGGGCRRNLFAARQADGKIGSESVHRLFERLALVLAISCDAGKIRELNQHTAVSAGHELGGIGKSEHYDHLS